MSRIYDAIKRAQAQRAKNQGSKSDAQFDRRRAPRVSLKIPIFVYGHNPRHEPFHEETTSLIVNAHGALLPLANRVRIGQDLLLTIPATQNEQPCRVVFVGAKQARRRKVGVAFAASAPEFWPAQSETKAP